MRAIAFAMIALAAMAIGTGCHVHPDSHEGVTIAPAPAGCLAFSDGQVANVSVHNGSDTTIAFRRGAGPRVIHPFGVSYVPRDPPDEVRDWVEVHESYPPPDGEVSIDRSATAEFTIHHGVSPRKGTKGEFVVRLTDTHGIVHTSVPMRACP